MDVQTIYDVQQLLKKFGTIIYIGDRLADLELMEDEIRELYRLKLIEVKDYQQALLLLRGEISRLRRDEGGETYETNNRN